MAAFPIQHFVAVQQGGIKTALQRSTVMVNSSNRFRRFFGSAARSISFAVEARELLNAPEDAFRARGMTREQALRKLIEQL
jgi:hypothetical protein